MKKLAINLEPLSFLWLLLSGCLLWVFKRSFREDIKVHRITLKRFRYFSKRMAEDDDALFSS
jgi:hypothetical protein